MLINFLRTAQKTWTSLVSFFRLLLPRCLGLRTGGGVRVGRGINWPLGNLRNIEIGEIVSLGKNGWFYIPLQNRAARIHIGAGTAIGDNFTISCNESICIGKNCLMSYRISILDHDHVTGLGINPVTSEITKGEPVEIGDNTFVGTGVVIMRGVKIGKNCVINANSVVMRSFEDNCIINGSPAKIVMMVAPVAK
ncbi:MAG TPA: acyltransferase [Methylomirabilota bacterium]|nr:acyltransferase [Methylomirabilota bacterium]